MHAVIITLSITAILTILRNATSKSLFFLARDGYGTVPRSFSPGTHTSRDWPSDISPGPGCPADLQSQSRNSELTNRGLLCPTGQSHGKLPKFVFFFVV